jgi:hypothetical protein
MSSDSPIETLTKAPLKEYIISIDSAQDIYNGNLSSFTTLLPARYRNIVAAQLIDIIVPGISNVYYEYISLPGFNQITSPSAGMNFAFAKIPLDGTSNRAVFADTNGYNYGYVNLENSIATLDRLSVSFIDGRGNLVPQPFSCTFQLRLLTGDLSPAAGGSTIRQNGRFLGGSR